MEQTRATPVALLLQATPWTPLDVRYGPLARYFAVGRAAWSSVALTALQPKVPPILTISLLVLFAFVVCAFSFGSPLLLQARERSGSIGPCSGDRRRGRRAGERVPRLAV